MDRIWDFSHGTLLIDLYLLYECTMGWDFLVMDFRHGLYGTGPRSAARSLAIGQDSCSIVALLHARGVRRIKYR